MNFEPRLHSRKVSEKDFLRVVGIMSLFAARKLKASGASLVSVSEIRGRSPTSYEKA